MKYILTIFILTFLTVFLIKLLIPKKTLKKIILNGRTINLELAQTPEQRATGLSGRDFLDANSGMLFIFAKKEIYPFWMKDTHIPLDIIWISDNKIVEMATLDLQVDDVIPEYRPKNPANYVLEVNAGFALENNIQIGNKVKFVY